MRRSALLLALLVAGPAAAQFPGSLGGVVRDAETGAPVPVALVEVPAAAASVRTDAGGAFLLRGLEPGSYRVVIRRAGYASRQIDALLRDGATLRLTVELIPQPIAVAGVSGAAGGRSAGELRLDRAAVRASGAADLAGLLASAGAGVVAGTGPTSERRLILRGGSADAVLVLVDGVPLNDPVTGEADLSAVPASSVERVTVLPGARSARYGPRAEAGVVLVETRAPDRRRELTLSAGTLGEHSAAAEWGSGAGMAAGAQLREVDGRFRYRGPFDGALATRRNADLTEGGGWIAAGGRVAGGELRARGGWDALERGIPGRAYRLTPNARQRGDRGRGQLGWRRAAGANALALSLSADSRRMHFSNPAPPDSFPYDSRVHARSLAARASLLHVAAGALREWGAGAELTAQHVAAGSLSDAAPRDRIDAGGWGTASLGRRLGGTDLALTLDLRADRDGVRDELFVSHGATLTAATGGARGQLSHRSAYSPPTLGDQFFREGVGVAPNPDLRAERVPGEWELSAEWAGAAVETGGSAFLGDVRGMIVWSPDYRGIWSPTNQDVRRSGVELWGRLHPAATPLTLSGEWSLNRVEYRWEPGLPRVQVVYRPRHSGAVRLGWAPRPWRAELAARYTGWRNPTPDDANRLPGFWTLDARMGRELRLAGFLLDASLSMDRLGNERDALIFGHPEPGRRVRLDLHFREADKP